MPPKSGGSTKQKPTKSEKTLALIAQRKREDYKRRFVPVENTLNKKLDSLGNEEERTRLAGINVAGVEQALGLGDSKQFLDGGSPNLAGIVARESTRATGRATGQTSASTAARERAQLGLRNIIARGRSQEGDAIGSLKTAANVENIEQVSKLQQKLANQQGLSSGLGTAAGLGLSYFLNRGGGLQGAGAIGSNGSPSIPAYDNALEAVN